MRTESGTTVVRHRYALERSLGQSGTVMVWLATDRVLDRTVIVELIHPTLGDDESFLERFDADARRLATLGHPNVARLFDSGIEDGIRFLVREWVRGETLRGRMQRVGPLSPDDACEIALSVLRGLEALHARGLLHLAVTPDTVLIADDGRVVLTGAAVAPAVVASRTGADAVALLGTHPAAPELLTGAMPDERTDVFEAGVLLKTMLASGESDPSSAHRERKRHLARSLHAAMLRATSDERSERFGSAHAFAEELERITAPAAGSTRLGPDASRGGSRPQRGRRARTIVGTWLLVPLVVVVLAVVTIALGLSLGELEVGGPLGIRPKHERASPSAALQALHIENVHAVDPPPGDGTENDSGLLLAIDGDDATAWRSENYFDGTMHKPGVGLLFDLGAERSISGVRIETPHAGWTFRIAVGDDPDALVDPSGPSITSEPITRVALPPTTGRYVMLWITSVVPTGDGDRAEVGEFTVIGRDA